MITIQKIDTHKTFFDRLNAKFEKSIRVRFKYAKQNPMFVLRYWDQKTTNLLQYGL